MEKIAEFEEFRSRAEGLLREVLERTWRSVVEGEGSREADVLLREEMGKFTREILGMVLSSRGGKETYGEEVICACGGRAKFKQKRGHQVGTVLPGKTVDVEAAYYVCEACREGVTPLLVELGTDGDGATVGLQELTVLAGVVAPYGEASNMLSKFAGLSVSGTRIQTRCVEEGEAAREGMRSIETENCGSAVCVAIDGGMIHVDNRWQEVKLGVIYGEDGRVEVSRDRSTLVSRDVVAVRGGPEDLSIEIESRFSCDLGRLDVVVLGDGAKWIWNLAEDLFPNRVEILDYYHAAEHLWLCALTLFGENSPETQKWVEEQKQRLLDDKVEVVIAALKWLRQRYRTGPRRKAIDDLIGYLENNAHRMLYKSFIEAGHPIGSGPVESAVKHVVQCRMKRPGTHWRARGADAMLALRCLYRSSGRWDLYWNTKKVPLKAA
jgi:hypothetical protein